MKIKKLQLLLTIFCLLTYLIFISPISAAAQEEPPPADDSDDEATYVVQSGDTLATIAYQFGISLEELIAANEIENPNAIAIGTELTLPGIIGIEGVLTNVTTRLGQSLESLSMEYDIAPKTLMRINKLVSPIEAYEGSSLTIPIKEELPTMRPVANVPANRTMLEEAVLLNQNQWDLAKKNKKDNLWEFLPGELIYQQTEEGKGTSAISPMISSIEISPEELAQGTIAAFTVVTTEDIALSGNLGEWTLHFFEESPNTYVAYTGIHALTEPGLIPFTLSGNQEDELLFSFDQMLVAYDYHYASETIMVDVATLDIEENEKEDALLFSLVEPATDTKYWSVPFTCVVEQPACIRSWFGTNRSYNEGYYYNFHTGLDYGVCASLNIYAPTDGTVIYTESLTVRGNTTIIDHGWGIYSAFYHQSEILVEEGQKVSSGEVIGLIGTTGRSTGPHLHYELLVNGVQVNPLNLLDPACQ